MSKKLNNNLIEFNYENGNKLYFTSKGKAALRLGVTPPSVQWAIDHHNTVVDNAGNKLNINLVDGSEIPYKYINN